MLAWFSDLNPRERRAMTACFGGRPRDARDVQIFKFRHPRLNLRRLVQAGGASAVFRVHSVLNPPRQTADGGGKAPGGHNRLAQSYDPARRYRLISATGHAPYPNRALKEAADDR